MWQSKPIKMLGLFTVVSLVFQRGQTVLNMPIQLEEETDLSFSTETCHNVSVLSCKCSSHNDMIKLNCSNRNLTHVPANIPSKTAQLILSDNNIEDISTGAFQNLNHVKLLDLSGNKIVKFRDGVFTALNQLESLYIQNNNFNLTPSAFDENVFLALRNLRNLNVKSKLCAPKEKFTYPDKAMARLSSLENLAIDGLSDINFGEGFRNLTSLRILDLSRTPNFTSISEEMFHNLKHSPIHRLLLNKCDLNWIHPNAFKYLTNIDTIDYSHNTALEIKGVSRSVYSLQNSTIRKIVFQNVHNLSTFTMVTGENTKYFKNTQLEELYVDNNAIIDFTIEAVHNLPKSVKILSVSRNIIHAKTEQVAALLMLKNLTEVNFSFQEHFEVENDRQNHSILDYAIISQLNEHLPTRDAGNEMSSVPNISLPPKLWRIQCSNAYKYDFDIPSLNLVHAAVKYADYSNNHLYRWTGPVYGLDKLEYFDLSGNDCHYISMNFFGYLPKLKTLKIANNHLGPELIQTIFYNLTSLKTLEMQQNIQENTLPGLFSRLTNLEKLDMSANYLTSWEANLSGLTKLVRLNLSKNKFTSLPQALREDLDEIAKQSHVQVDLQDNHLQCVCGTINFVSWFVQTQVEFSHLNSTTCRLENDTDVSLTHSHAILKYLQNHCRSYTIAISVTSACVGISLVILLIYLVRRNRWRIRYILYRFMNRKERSGYQKLEGDVNENSFAFDAFISYEDSSRSFVLNEVIPRLEQEANLKLSIDKRDFIPGLLVEDNIMHAIQNSKKTIVLLTRDFLRSNWCMYELNMARMEEIHTGRQLLTVVLLEDIPTTEYSREVLDLFVRHTYIERVDDEYGAQLFWQRLLSAINDDTNLLNPSL